MLLLALIALGVPLALSLRDRVNSEVRSQAQSQAQVVAGSAAELIEPPRLRVLSRLARSSAASVRGRVIVVDSQGRLLADSGGEPVGESYADRPEVRSALAGHGEQITRDSKTLGTEILATSVPVFEHGRPRGAVRITQSVEAVHRAIRSSILDVAALAAIVLAMGLIVGWLIAAQIARPIRRLDRAARRVAGGDLEAVAAVEGSAEQRSLARTFNEMTARVRRLLRVQQDFVADASHQLRTPLTGLRLRLEGLGERFRGDQPVEAEVDAAMREIDRLSHVVDELLILSRAGEHDRPAEEVDLGAVVRRADERWRASAAAHGVGLEVGRRWRAPARLDLAARPRPRPRRAGRERLALFARRLDRDDRLRAAHDRGARPRAGARCGRGGRRVRALPPRRRRSRRARRHGARPADRARADPPVGRRRAAGAARGRRPSRGDRDRDGRMSLRTSLRWIGLALLGLVIAAGVALAASQLASQQIGIASESVSAGDSLAPPVTSAPKTRHEESGRAAQGKEGRQTTAQPSPAEEAVEPPDEETVEPPVAEEPATSEAPTESTEPEAPAIGPSEPRSGDDSGGSDGGQGQGGGGRDD